MLPLFQLENNSGPPFSSEKKYLPLPFFRSQKKCIPLFYTDTDKKLFGKYYQRCTGVHRFTHKYCLFVNENFQQAAIMWSKLFDAALRRSVYPGDCGSSAIDDKYPSSFLLNVGRSTFVRLRMDFGISTKNSKTCINKSLYFSIAVFIGSGTTHIRPCLIDDMY